MKQNWLKKIILVTLAAILLSGCSLQSPSSNSEEPAPSPAATQEPSSTPQAYTPSDPLEIFLVELTQETELAFDSPVKADIFWNEGDSASTLKTYFGDSFLITHTDATMEHEKIVSDYLIGEGFVKMGFNGSIGEGSQKMGYRKDDLICKTEFDTYPDELAPHLVVYCTDATKGTLRK